MVAISPSLTQKQAQKFNDLQIAALRKSGLPKKETQEVLEEDGGVLADEFVKLVRDRVERKPEMIIRPFKIDRSRTREQMIDALGRVKYVNSDVLATMPLEGPDEGDMYFFPSKRYIPVAEQPAALAERGLVPHPAAQIQVNIDDPSFADEHPNGVQWDGNSYATFNRWYDKRKVNVNRNDYDWNDYWWFGGVRKPDTK